MSDFPQGFGPRHEMALFPNGPEDHACAFPDSDYLLHLLAVWDRLHVREMAETYGVWRKSRAASRYIEVPYQDERIPMSSISGPEHLSGHHRDTLLQIFQQRTNHNVEWHDVVSLLEAVGSIEQRHDDMFCSASVERPKFSGVLVTRTSTDNNSSTCAEC